MMTNSVKHFQAPSWQRIQNRSRPNGVAVFGGTNITVSNPPDLALINRYRNDPDCYTDCYRTEVAFQTSLSCYVTMFYTSWLFRLERIILKWTVNRPSSDADAKSVANGEADRFAAWTVEERTETQLLMCDMAGRTRSWFMIEPDFHRGTTALFFGSAVVPIKDKRTGEKKLGFVFKVLLGFHKLYSRALMSAARNRLCQNR